MAKGVDHTEGNLGLCRPHSHSIPSKVNWSRYKDLTIYIHREQWCILLSLRNLRKYFQPLNAVKTYWNHYKLDINSLKEIDMNFLLIFVRQMGG